MYFSNIGSFLLEEHPRGARKNDQAIKGRAAVGGGQTCPAQEAPPESDPEGGHYSKGIMSVLCTPPSQSGRI